MNAKALMVATAVFLAVAGAATSFAPSETLALLTAPSGDPLPVVVQLMGGLYLALAVMNWMARDKLVGGIYSRPLTLGNLLHFVTGSLALAKYVAARGVGGPLAVVLACYACFAVAFGYLVFGRGAARKTSPDGTR